jgi:hypothetical protein
MANCQGLPILVVLEQSRKEVSFEIWQKFSWKMIINNQVCAFSLTLGVVGVSY